MHKPRITLEPKDVAGAVDLDRIDCTGCRHRSVQGVCRRFPPLFQPSTPVQDAKGTMTLAPGGWTFPPAVERCGEFMRPDGVSLG